MLAAILLALLSGAAVVGPDTVLVKDDPAVAASDEGSVLGWRRVPESEVAPGAETVPDATLQLLDVDPTADGLYGDQWGLPTLGIPWAWEMSSGRGVMIAVVDSGIDVGHRDLAARLFTNPAEIQDNGVDDDGNGFVDDVHGWDVVDGDPDPSDPTVPHGTQVASVALGSANGFGLVGGAPEATLMPVRACRSECRLLDVAAAIVYATDMGADVINLSIGGYAQPGPLADAVDHAEEAGVVVTAAAGNLGDDIDDGGFVPAGLANDNVLTVAATDRADRLWDGSNTGSSVVDVGGPGVEIVVAVPDPPDGHTVATGTSFSAPHAAAVASLLLEASPDLDPGQVVEIIGRHGEPVPDLATSTRHGTRLQADRALAAVKLADIGSSIFDREIAWLYVEGITKGCNPPAQDHYCPTHPVTRGEMAALLTRALDLPTGPDAFTDDDTSIFQPDINALAASGITKGCNPPAQDHYCPTHPVTRGEMAAFLRRVLKG